MSGVVLLLAAALLPYSLPYGTVYRVVYRITLTPKINTPHTLEQTNILFI